MSNSNGGAGPYCDNILSYSRRLTRVVMVGDAGVGGDNPIRVQSMTTTLTKDVEATANQAERLVQAGCEIVRITTPTPDDSRCLKDIRAILDARGVKVPLVADIHFSPLAAMVAADYADKVRVNPGNYVDSRKFAIREYSDTQYNEEIERMAERFTPLVLKCKERGIAMRIGTNHGSLSDRIMNRFGDTPEGMCESALEFVRVCESHGYYEVIFSMKASNPKVMIAAYRLLAARMTELGMTYPFHLGVTEAGNAEDGRIKSAIGIGSLLEDGIGDTIRVSLTEEPEEEIPVAQAIANRYADSRKRNTGEPADIFTAETQRTQRFAEGLEAANVRMQFAPTSEPASVGEPAWDPIHYARRKSHPVALGHVKIGAEQTVAVGVEVEGPLGQSDLLAQILRWASPAGRRQPKPDLAWLNIESEADVHELQRVRTELDKHPLARLALIASGCNPSVVRSGMDWADAASLRVDAAGFLFDDLLPLVSPEVRALNRPVILSGTIEECRPRDIDGEFDAAMAETLEVHRVLAEAGVPTILSVDTPNDCLVAAARLLVMKANERGIIAPVLIQARSAHAEGGIDWLLDPSIGIGSLLCDGIGDAVMVRAAGDTLTLAFNILQASGARITKTDYVACPSCGRTLFDLQETTERIKQRTSHLVGVRLAIMGCIVNGPGEMADADFGYVGGAPGKVNLYVGKECVERGVPAEVADDRLIALIKDHGKWQEELDEEEALLLQPSV